MNNEFNTKLKVLKEKLSQKMDELNTIRKEKPLGKDGYISEELEIRKWYGKELELLREKYEL